MQSVNPLREGLAFHGNWVAKFNRRVFICACSPDLSERDKSAPNLSPLNQRPVISDRDVGQPDALFGDRELTSVRPLKIGPQCGDRHKTEKYRSENKCAFSDRFHDD